MPELKEKMRQKRKRERTTAFLVVILLLSVVLLCSLLLVYKKQHKQTPAPADPVPVTDTVTDTPDPVDTVSSSGSAMEADPVTDSAITPEEQKDTVLVFTGDVLLSDYVLDNYRARGIDGVISPDLQEAMTSADITMVNNEFPYSLRGEKAKDKQFTFRVDPKYVSVLTDMGVDIAGIANNHVLDYGSDALLDTFDTLDNAGIDYVGAGTTEERASALITKEVNGKTYGFLAASRVIPVVSWDIANASPGVFTTYDPAKLCAAITQARSECDFLTVFVHWGIERNEYPESYQTELAKNYIDSGADLVVGMHPHVLQGVSFYKGKPIFYSLGNYIFNQSIPKTALLRVTVSADNTPSFQLVAASAANAKTYALEADEETAVYDYIQSISTDVTIDSDGFVSAK